MSLSETRGQVITFYSYKGGTGRTMALANVACLLAQREPPGNPVLMIDWDLEAPGLHNYFRTLFKGQFSGREYKDYKQDFDRHPGLIDLFLELGRVTQKKTTEEEAASMFDKIGLKHFILKTDIPSVYLLKAGCFDKKYPQHVSTFQWVDLYERAPWLIRAFAETLSEKYGYVLIDSRTGLTDISNICTMLMPEKLVVVFTPNRQSLTGVLDLIQHAVAYRRQSDDLRPLAVFPLPSRIELTENILQGEWRNGGKPKMGIPEEESLGYQALFEKVFRDVYELPDCKLDHYFDEVQIQHIPRYAYGEEIAVLIEAPTDRLSLARSYQNFTDRLVNLTGPWEDTGATKFDVHLS